MTTIIHTIHELQEALDGLVPLMLEKGFREPSATGYFRSQEGGHLTVRWKRPEDGPWDIGQSQSFVEGSIEEQYSAVLAYVAAQPTKEERQRREFTEQLAKLIELGRASGMPDGWVSPLETAMKRLSKNALTDGRATP